MRASTLVGVLAASLPAVLASTASGQEAGGVTIHGFASQGYLNSSDNRLFSAPTDQGTFAFTDEAGNGIWQGSPRLRIGAQIFARDLGSQGNHRPTFDWALGDYRWRDWLGVRAGRLKLPMGLYSTVIDADAARPEILQPNGVYSVASRDVTVTFNGGQVYGLVPLGRAGDLEYEAWGGTADLEGSEALQRLLRDGAAALLPALGLAGADYTVGGFEAPAKFLIGGALEWRPPLAGLRLRTGVMGGELDVLSSTLYTGFAGPLPAALKTNTSIHIEQRYFLISSLGYQRGPLRVSAEYYRQRFETETVLTGLPAPGPIRNAQRFQPEGQYVQVAYRFARRFQASAYYSTLYADRDDHEGVGQIARGLPEHNGYEKDLATTLRFDITPHWLVKVEFHDVDGTQTVAPSEQ